MNSILLKNKNSNSRSKNSFFQDELIESKVVDEDDENDVFPDSVGDLLGIQVKSERNDFMVRTLNLLKS
jgi:ribosomal 30S subunit maturation factor RimM